MTTFAIHTSAPTTPSTPHRVDRRAIWATALVAIASLVVLLRLLPGADAAWEGARWGSGTTVLFIGGAVLAVTTIGAALVLATKRSGH